MTQETVLFDILDWMDDPVPREAALNMAIDECLLAGLATTPLLRVYRWSEPAVSIGYFEAVRDARKTFPDRAIVRRWTGGGIVEHGSDLTYSLLVPRSLIPISWRGGEAYRAIHRAVAGVLQMAKFEGIALTGEGSENPAGSVPNLSHECFKNPVMHDVSQHGQKIAGAAQRRTRHGLLHQGSIRVATREQIGIEPPSTESVSLNAIRVSLPEVLGRRLECRQVTATELGQSNMLAAVRYGTAEWLEKF